MRIRTLLTAAAILGAAVLPAHADDEGVTAGYNNGDAGVVSVTFGASVSTGTHTGPMDGLLDAKCEFYQATRPSSNDVTLVVEGHGVTSPRNGQRAVSTSVRCQLKNKFTNAVVFDERYANETMVNAWTPQIEPTDATSYIVCVATQATYADTSIIGDLNSLHCL